MTEPRKFRRLRSRLPLSRVDRRILKRIVGIGAAAFLAGYLLTALLFLRGASRPDVVSVPDLRSLGTEEASQRLEDLGLDLQLGDSLPHPRVPIGDILAQSPLPGREVAPGTSVRVILSAGRPQSTVPDVSGLPQEAALRLLTASGFQVRVEEVPARAPKGRIVSIEPAPGSSVRLPAAVQLRISAGPPLVAVPELTGLGEEEARQTLERLGLRLGEIEYQFDESGSFEMVVSQYPSPGDSIRAGTAVQVRILTSRPGNDWYPGE